MEEGGAGKGQALAVSMPPFPHREPPVLDRSRGARVAPWRGEGHDSTTPTNDSPLSQSSGTSQRRPRYSSMCTALANTSHECQTSHHDEVLPHEAHKRVGVLPRRHPTQGDSHQPRGPTIDQVVLVPADMASCLARRGKCLH